MGILKTWRGGACLAVLAVAALSGCSSGPKKIDPWEKTNKFFYRFNDGLDRVALKPAANLYEKVVPKPVRTGVGNGFHNLGYGNVIVNDFLQAKWGQGFADAARMAVNTTVGIAGVLDVATRCGLPAHDNDFGITLGKWGADTGPYLVLPLLGPSTIRDAPGIGVAMVTDPVFWIAPPWWVGISLNSLNAVDSRSRAEGWVRFRNQAAIDPYVFTRDAYLQYRLSQINEGRVPVDQGLYDDDSEPTTHPTSRPSPHTYSTTQAGTHAPAATKPAVGQE